MGTARQENKEPLSLSIKPSKKPSAPKVGTTRSEKIRALKTGAEYGASGAGAAGMTLGILALFVSISNPIILAISGIVGSIFCCLGGCNALEEAKEKRANEIKPEAKLTDVKPVQDTKHFVRHNSTLFSPDLDAVNAPLFDGPHDLKMEEEYKPKRSASI